MFFNLFNSPVQQFSKRALLLLRHDPSKQYNILNGLTIIERALPKEIDKNNKLRNIPNKDCGNRSIHKSIKERKFDEIE